VFADFFPGKGKIFHGSQGGAKTYYFCLKTPIKILFSSKKIEKHTILAGQGEGQGPPFALP